MKYIEAKAQLPKTGNDDVNSQYIAPSTEEATPEDMSKFKK